MYGESGRWLLYLVALASAGGWWRGRRLSLALPGAGVDPPAPADGATESGKCRSFIPRSRCMVAGLLFYPPAHQKY